ncbi:hypothetical protein ACFQ7F_13030 [Streptomyces sp. NPDC056486]|uniref:hypothetical protein n=1 Tax=Streptomyces sp. NPDC056486 TaxID=3345835 RepID=UPI0036C04F97
MTDETPAEREERIAAQEAADVQGLAWTQVWRHASTMGAVEFARWARESGNTLSGPTVDAAKRQYRHARDRFEEHKARKAAEEG